MWRRGLEQIGCSDRLYQYHQDFVERSTRAIQAFDRWLQDHHPEAFDDPHKRAALRDAFHRNWHGLRERLGFPQECSFNISNPLTRRLGTRLRGQSHPVRDIIAQVTSDDGVRAFQADRDAIRLFDCIAHLEYETYRDLITSLGDYPAPADGSGDPVVTG